MFLRQEKKVININQALLSYFYVCVTLSLTILGTVLLSILSICHFQVDYLIHSSQNYEVGGAGISTPISQMRKLRYHK